LFLKFKKLNLIELSGNLQSLKGEVAMESLIIKIRLMKDSKEKDDLLKTYFEVRKYVKVQDKDALKKIVARLNSAYPQMSKTAREISLALAQVIKEATD